MATKVFCARLPYVGFAFQGTATRVSRFTPCCHGVFAARVKTRTHDLAEYDAQSQTGHLPPPPQARAYSVRCCPMAPQFSASTDTIHSHASHSSLAIPTRLPLALVQAMQLLRSTLSTWANRRLANYWRHWRSVGRTMARAPTRARDPNEAAQIQPRTVHRTKDHPMLQVLLCCHFRAKLAAC